VPRSFRVERVALQGTVDEVRYRKRDDGRRYAHEVEQPTDAWLVNVNGKRGALLVPRGEAPLWERDGATHWFTNPPRRKARMKRRRTTTAQRRRTSATRRKTKRPVPRGFKTWSAYMASIRPKAKSTSQGGTMARRKRRRSTARRQTKRRSRRSVVVYSAPRRRARRYRRNPGGGFSVGGVINRVKDAAVGAVCVVGGEAGTRFIRGNLLGMADGETLSSVAELAIATGLGMVGERFIGRQIARDVTVGGFAAVLRGVAKQTGIPMLGEVLGDYGGGGRRYRVVDGRFVPLNGYPPRSALNGYVGTGGGMSTLSGEQEEELGY
jgi:hypothetical protein